MAGLCNDKKVSTCAKSIASNTKPSLAKLCKDRKLPSVTISGTDKLMLKHAMLNMEELDLEQVEDLRGGEDPRYKKSKTVGGKLNCADDCKDDDSLTCTRSNMEVADPRRACDRNNGNAPMCARSSAGVATSEQVCDLGAGDAPACAESKISRAMLKHACNCSNNDTST